MSVCPTNGSCIHWSREDHPVHGNGRIHGWEAVFEVSIQKKGCFSGREDINKKRDTPKGCLCSYLVMRCPIRSGMT